MFGKKKKKAQEEARAAAAAERERLLRQLNSLADEINTVADAGEKLFLLEELKHTIFNVIDGKLENIKAGADKKGDGFFMGGAAIQLPAFWVAALATGVTPMILAAIPVAMGTYLWSNRISKKERARLEGENAHFLKELRGLAEHVSALTDKVLDEQTEAVARSARREELFERFPDVKSRFALAAARKMAANDAKPKPPEQGGDGPGI